MKTKKIFLLFFCAFFLLGSGFLAGCDNEFLRFFFRSEPRVTQKQIDYLKKHQDEIKDFIKSLNPKIESVQIDWSDVEAGEIGNGTPQGGGEVIRIGGGFNEIEESSWGIIVRVDEKGNIDLDSMGLVSPLRIDNDIFK